MKYFYMLIFCITIIAIDVSYARHKYSETIPRYETDIKPIFSRYCSSCHVGSMSYDVAFKLRNKIYDKFVQQRAMPPKHLSQPTEFDVQVVKRWIETGAHK